uniref:Uncharacterized protein n=2 Tax=Oryza sativa subsp. japonica TaxID=39947 RepID=Q84QX5_ORYSJ|nr:hypothetical protein [Oryza sativa Japonica Group]ABF96399.1 hypothetical protein LOC_Os03g27630 [Oryza sativa Japonica Group]
MACGFVEVAAGLAFVAAVPKEVAAQDEGNQDDGARWLERRPAAERGGAREERISGDSGRRGRWRPKEEREGALFIGMGARCSNNFKKNPENNITLKINRGGDQSAGVSANELRLMEMVTVVDGTTWAEGREGYEAGAQPCKSSAAAAAMGE